MDQIHRLVDQIAKKYHPRSLKELQEALEQEQSEIYVQRVGKQPSSALPVKALWKEISTHLEEDPEFLLEASRLIQILPHLSLRMKWTPET